MSEAAFLQALREDPDDLGCRLVYADWLEEHGDPRGELLRLTHALTAPSAVVDRPRRESDLRALLARGVLPIGPVWTNSLGMAFAWVPAGAFLMGSPATEPQRRDDEAAHRVRLTRGFYMGVHPVTQAQWVTVMSDNPSRFRGDRLPVEGISWEDCQDFCKRLTKLDGLSGGLPSPYRLPTEAEWEYACRGATSSAYSFGEEPSVDQANFLTNYSPGEHAGEKFRQTTSPVGSFAANGWGLTDMHGNVFEWCADWYAPYPNEATDPEGGPVGEVRVLRGGSWHSLAGRCRSASRAWGAPRYRGSDVGCRVCFRTEYHYAI